MPVTKSAKKALKRSKKQQEFNQPFKDNMKDAIRNIRQKAKKGETITDQDINKAKSATDKAVKARIITKKNAANKKSRIQLLANKVKNG